MKIKYENKELLDINKALTFSDLSRYEQDKIMSYILKLHKEIDYLEMVNEELRKEVEEKNVDSSKM